MRRTYIHTCIQTDTTKRITLLHVHAQGNNQNMCAQGNNQYKIKLKKIKHDGVVSKAKVQYTVPVKCTVCALYACVCLYDTMLKLNVYK